VYYPDESIIRRFGVWHFLCLQVSGGNLSVSLSLPRHYIVTMYVPSCGDNVLQDFVFICEGVEAVGRSYLSNSNYGAIASYYYYLRHFLRRHHRLLPVEKVKANTLMAALRNSMHKFYHVYCTNPNYRGKRWCKSPKRFMFFFLDLGSDDPSGSTYCSFSRLQFQPSVLTLNWRIKRNHTSFINVTFS
jgi:hypothetical protein